MAGMFLSFIIPVYNAGAYLRQCLDALYCQDIPREDYEILCVDDGSTDGSGDILDAYAAEDSLFRVIHTKNGGVAAARALGLSQARGSYIWFLDADDHIAENSLGKLRALAEASGCDRLVVGGYTFTDALTPEEQEASRQGLLPCNVPWEDSVAWRNLLRRDFLSTHGLTFRYPELTHGEDGLFMYEISAAQPKALEIPDIIYFYRIHSDSAETADAAESHRKKLASYQRITHILYGYYRSGRREPITADRLMTFLWFTLYETAQLPRREGKPVLEDLRALGLYPGKPLPECTMTHTYLFSRSRFLGRVLNSLSFHLQSPWAYGMIRVLLRGKRWVRKCLGR